MIAHALTVVGGKPSTPHLSWWKSCGFSHLSHWEVDDHHMLHVNGRAYLQTHSTWTLQRLETLLADNNARLGQLAPPRRIKAVAIDFSVLAGLFYGEVIHLPQLREAKATSRGILLHLHLNGQAYKVYVREIRGAVPVHAYTVGSTSF